RCSPQSGSCSGTGAEVAHRQISCLGLGPCPCGDLAQSTSQQLDVEHVCPVELLVCTKQVEEQRGQSGLVAHGSDKAVPGTVAAAAAAMCEEDDPDGLFRNG